jgi:hypothetical protein
MRQFEDFVFVKQLAAAVWLWLNRLPKPYGAM